LFDAVGLSRKILHPSSFLKFFFQQLKILKPYFTRIFGIKVYTKLQSSIPFLKNLMKLCHVMHAHPENFPFSQQIYRKTPTFDI